MKSSLHTVVALFATLAVIAGFGILGLLRGSFTSVSGDEGSFIAMIESLSGEGDLKFGAPDRARVEAAAPGGRQALILQRNQRGLSYSKPTVYPLLATPGYLLFGEKGVFLLQFAAFAFVCWLAWGFLCRLGDGRLAFWTFLTIVGASSLMPYLAYRTSDIMQAILSIGGCALCLASVRDRDGAGEPGRVDKILGAGSAPMVGGVLLGLLGATRYPNLIVALGVVAALVAARRWKPAALTLVGAVVAFLVVSAATLELTGSVNPYRVERTTFNADTGFPTGPTDDIANYRYKKRPAKLRMSLTPNFDAAVSSYSAGYYLVGRHTGVLWYFPALIVILAALIAHRPDRVTLVLCMTVLAGVVFYLIWMPRNYYGGATFIGNRYFLPLYPVLWMAIRRLPSRRWLGVPWAVALVVFVSSLISVATSRNITTGSQTHTYAGVFRWLPFESTARAIEGRRDRYWSGDFLRFTDPWGQVLDDRVVLRTGEPATEVAIASQDPDWRLHLAVASSSPGVELHVSDWRSSQSYGLEGSQGAQETLAVDLSRRWRRHTYWWNLDEVYDARVVRLWVESPNAGEPVEVRYLGPEAGPG